MNKSCLFIIIWGMLFPMNILGKEIKILGRVVAYESTSARVSSLTHVPKRETLIIRIEKSYGNREKSKYIKVIYEYIADENTLPQSIFEGDKMWQLKLQRKPNCDSTLSKDYPTVHKAEVLSDDRTIEYDNPATFLTFTNAQDKDIPTDTNLPCYSLKSASQIKSQS
jgi:hypothetical protein